MIITVAILATVSGMAVPRIVALIDSQDSRDFQSTLRRLGNEARLLSIESGDTVTVIYKSDERQIVIQSLDDESQETQDQSIYSLPESVDLTGFQIAGEEVSDADWIVEFYPDGSGKKAAIEVQDGSRIYTVAYDARTGSATLGNMGLFEDESTDWEAGELEQRVEE